MKKNLLTLLVDNKSYSLSEDGKFSPQRRAAWRENHRERFLWCLCRALATDRECKESRGYLYACIDISEIKYKLNF